jgi:hypothetical protein
MRRCRKCPVGVAVSEQAIADEIAPDRLMQEGGTLREGRLGIDHGRALSVLHLDEVERIFGLVAIGRDRDGDRLADIAHALDRDSARLHGRSNAGEERPGDVGDIGSGNNCDDPRERACGLNIDRQDIGMRVRRAQDRRVQRARLDAKIIDVAAATRQQSGVLDALDGTSEPVDPVHFHGQFPPIFVFARALVARSWRPSLASREEFRRS